MCHSFKVRWTFIENHVSQTDLDLTMMITFRFADKPSSDLQGLSADPLNSKPLAQPIAVGSIRVLVVVHYAAKTM